MRVIVMHSDDERRREINRFITERCDADIVGLASTRRELLRIMKNGTADVVVISACAGDGRGLEAVQKVMASFPRPVLVAVSRAGFGVKEALESLRSGAIEIISHPADYQHEEWDSLVTTFREKLQLVARIKVIRHIIPIPIRSDTLANSERDMYRREVRVVAIGASTGGPLLLQNLFQTLPASVPASFLVVQHMLKHFTKELADSLDRLSYLQVKEAEDGELIKQGCVYIAPGSRHMEIGVNRQIVLNNGPEVSGHRPSVDVLMKSVAQGYGGRAVGVILSGMGRDGTLGLRAIKEHGGVTMAQDEITSVVFGMPGAAIESGFVDHVVPAEELAVKILEMM